MVTKTRSTTSADSGPRDQKTRRVAVRLTVEMAERLERAVAISGRTQTDLITEAIADKASEIEREHRILELTDRDMGALLAAIESPPPPNAAMLRAVARWRDAGSP